MPINRELDELKSREQAAFSRKQLAFKNYKNVRDRTNAAYDVMQRAWEERVSARERMNREYEAMKSMSENYHSIWGDYRRIRDRNNSRIESLRREADYEHREMQSCFDRASNCYNYGNKSEAPYWSSQGREHKSRRNRLNEEVSRLCKEVKSAKQNAEWRAPKTDSSAFRAAKAAFESAKSRHQSAQSKFKQLKNERNRLKAEFDSLHKEHSRIKEEFQRKLAKLKEDNKRERERILDKAGVKFSDRKDAKIVKKSDGTTQVYHGGIGGGDGLGHGHTALDQFGNKTYDRGAFEDHGSQNFTDSKYGTFNGKPAKIYPDKRQGHEGWQNILYSNKGDFSPGEDHGHILVNEAGSIMYWRDQGQKHGDEYFIDEAKDDHTKI